MVYLQDSWLNIVSTNARLQKKLAILEKAVEHNPENSILAFEYIKIYSQTQMRAETTDLFLSFVK